MKIILILLITCIQVVIAQATFTGPEKYNLPKAQWCDENNIYTCFSVTKGLYTYSDNPTKSFCFSFYRVDRSNNIYGKTYNFDNQFTYIESTTFKYTYHNQYFICCIKNKIICFDLLNDDYWQVAELGDSMPYFFNGITNGSAKLYSIFDNQKMTIELFLPGINTRVLYIDLVNRSCEVSTLNFEDEIVAEVCCKIENSLVLKMYNRTSGTTSWRIYDVEKDILNVIQLPNNVKGITDYEFFYNELSGALYLYIAEIYYAITSSQNWSCILKIDISTGSSEMIYNLQGQPILNAFPIGNGFIIEVVKKAILNSYEYLAIVDNSTKIYNTNSQLFSGLFAENGNYYAFYAKKKGEYKLLEIDSNTLEFNYLKDFSINEKDLFLPITTFYKGVGYSFFKKFDKGKNLYTIESTPQY